MSYKRREPGVLVSGAIGAGAGVAVVAGLLLLLALPAQARRDAAHSDQSAAIRFENAARTA